MLRVRSCTACLPRLLETTPALFEKSSVEPECAANGLQVCGVVCPLVGFEDDVVALHHSVAVAPAMAALVLVTHSLRSC